MSKIICPGCLLQLADAQLAPSDRYNASGECEDLFNELSIRTFAMKHPDFRHQLAVDAYGAQHAGGVSKPMTTAYALIGLYLALEHGFTGRQVQHVHSIIVKQTWEQLTPPATPAGITVQDALKAPGGDELYAAMQKWARAVWDSWAPYHNWVKEKATPYI
ncbi:DUF5946 family protein [Chitinophaga eiseniae]|uniref:Serine/threonine protein kinase n=1 Tax=Chitinophaga eiseniae TaxID=634771 RepID=A0A847SPQ1_9BACT|nr:DUF5946 family protein [Chitinophaga eiseniae]NLR81385.1 serine/threonine protein kinase [Chitinophaga eiseniae]